jgi:hypothetical protein
LYNYPARCWKDSMPKFWLASNNPIDTRSLEIYVFHVMVPPHKVFYLLFNLVIYIPHNAGSRISNYVE